MTNDQINEAVAKYCGWTELTEDPECGFPMGIDPAFPNHAHYPLPDFADDLNACAEMVKSLASSQRRVYTQNLYDIVCGEAAPESDDWFYVTNATPKQRCETFLKSLGLWEEDSSSANAKDDQREAFGPSSC